MAHGVVFCLPSGQRSSFFWATIYYWIFEVVWISRYNPSTNYLSWYLDSSSKTVVSRYCIIFCIIFQQLCGSVTKYLKPYCLPTLAVVSLLTMIWYHLKHHLLYFIYKGNTDRNLHILPRKVDLTKLKQKETWRFITIRDLC